LPVNVFNIYGYFRHCVAVMDDANGIAASDVVSPSDLGQDCWMTA